MGVSADQIRQIIPIGQIGTRQEMGEICLFLATDMAGQLTGSTIYADGGIWMANGNEREQMQSYKQWRSKL